MGAIHRLQLVYARLPQIACKGLCFQSCGPIACSTLEAEIMARASGRELNFDAVSGRCTYLDADNRCAVYKVRPLVCRAYGATLTLPCPHGCAPTSPPLTRPEELSLFVRVLEVGGLPYMSQPDNWLVFEQHHTYHKQLKGRTMEYGPKGERP